MQKKPDSWMRLSHVLKAASASTLLLMATAVAYADQAPAAAAAPRPLSMSETLMPFLLMFGVVWMMILRPQQKRMREQQDVIKTLKHGDEVLTTSGILGRITGITDKVVTIEVADDVRLKMLKSQVSQVLKGPLKDLP